MKIGVISDTHITKKNICKLKNFIDNNLKDVDTIIHAGDYTDLQVLLSLKSSSNFIGVYGNNDKEPLKSYLNETEIVTLNKYKIAIFHGHGNEKNTLERAYEKFKDEKVDIIIFGHSHQPLIVTKNNILMLNPGSLYRKHREKMHSYIILELEKSNINAQIRFF